MTYRCSQLTNSSRSSPSTPDCFGQVWRDTQKPQHQCTDPYLLSCPLLQHHLISKQLLQSTLHFFPHTFSKGESQAWFKADKFVWFSTVLFLEMPGPLQADISLENLTPRQHLRWKTPVPKGKAWQRCMQLERVSCHKNGAGNYYISTGIWHSYKAELKKPVFKWREHMLWEKPHEKCFFCQKSKRKPTLVENPAFKGSPKSTRYKTEFRALLLLSCLPSRASSAFPDNHSSTASWEMLQEVEAQIKIE